MATIDDERVTRCLTQCLQAHEGMLEPREAALCRRNFAPPLQRFADRLLALDFKDFGRVLDACAGFGQWSVCLAALNDRVDACDVSPVRASFLHMLAAGLGMDNIDALACNLESLPYDDDSFDAAFCYVSLTCTGWKESLAELHRVLRPGGRVYFTANGLGYHVRMWVEEPHKTRNRSPRFFTALTLQNTVAYQEHGALPKMGQIVVEKDEMRDFLGETGFTILAMEDEGRIDMSGGAHPPTPFFPGQYRGMTCCYEVLAVK